MSHGPGLVRTTCSSGSAPGVGAGAGQLGASSSEGLLDPVYPRTHGALLKVAQMISLLIAFICVRSSLWTSYSAYSYFEVVTVCNLIMILAFYLVHLFRLYRVLTCISWPLSMPPSDALTARQPCRRRCRTCDPRGWRGLSRRPQKKPGSGSPGRWVREGPFLRLLSGSSLSRQPSSLPQRIFLPVRERKAASREI
ncbi:CKLF-like MARVEL transmembrane domain-containing protein 7 isoform X2 [Balaenoptera acutorostrata]|uniref:CKLF-like MARVEL transmembrane domain-containing protein 7 isoform X2 n=1 Tax=Balaenoptera acutorostrata TaxID=9767 RepID=A0ABM3UBJ4_BALAC|nr:CKLF-like MARVEL transmembrane domain-containing protein 7 isoform X2 [Balaenoptera acutorostrata]